MINKKQRAKLRLKLKELGIMEIKLFPCRDGHKLIVPEFMFSLTIRDLTASGLTKKKMEVIINEVKLKLKENWNIS